MPTQGKPKTARMSRDSAAWLCPGSEPFICASAFTERWRGKSKGPWVPEGEMRGLPSNGEGTERGDDNQRCASVTERWQLKPTMTSFTPCLTPFSQKPLNSWTRFFVFLVFCLDLVLMGSGYQLHKKLSKTSRAWRIHSLLKQVWLYNAPCYHH